MVCLDCTEYDPSHVTTFSLLAGRGGAGEGGLGSSASTGSCSRLARDRILRAELSKVSSKCSRQLTALETLGELLAGGDLRLQPGGRGDQAAEDAPLRHLQSLRHRRNSRQASRQSRHVRLHVGEQLLQLVENLRGKHDETE